MVNPDGVVLGNYRTNLMGKDMNRCFFADEVETEKRQPEVELIRDLFKKYKDSV